MVYTTYNIQPVSYTHLDVYKRQRHNQATRDILRQSKNRTIRTPVSYTHLDVYKRQELSVSK